MNYLLILAIASSFILQSTAYAEMYKCKNAQGKTTYTDLPCQKLGATTVKAVEAPTTSGLYDGEAIKKSKNGYLNSPAKPTTTYTQPAVTTTYQVDGKTTSEKEYHAAICKGYRQRLEYVENRLRAGYKAWESDSLHKEQKYYWDKIVAECKTGEGI